VLDFKGADKVEIDARGDLVLHAPGGDIRQHKPVVYQEIDGVRQDVAGRYVRKGAERVGFEVAAYDTSKPLVIDPVVLAYSTYLGPIVSIMLGQLLWMPPATRTSRVQLRLAFQRPRGPLTQPAARYS